MRAWTILAGSGVLSTVLALALPPSPVAWPGWAYCILPIVMPVFGTLGNRRRKPLLEASGRAS